MDTILGGSSSSRLFREVREKRGLAYSVGSYSAQFADQGTVAMYVGTREDNVAEACEVIAAELESLRTTPVGADELERAKEHVKGRTVLVLESTSARMSRNANAVLFDLPLLGIDDIIAKIDAVTIEDVAALAAELYAGENISAACIGADEGCFRKAVAPVSPALTELMPDPIRVAVAGAAGRMGATVCAAVEEADGLELTGRVDPALGTELAEVLAGADVVVDFTVPDQAMPNAHQCLHAGVSVVIGTTGFDLEKLRRCANDHWDGGRGGRAFVAPNFAIGAVLMMELAQRVAGSHARGRDRRAAPRPQARQAVGHGGPDRRSDRRGRRQRPRADPLDPPAGPRRPPGGHLRRRGADALDPPRLDRSQLVHARRRPRLPPGRLVAGAADGRAREPARWLIPPAFE